MEFLSGYKTYLSAGLLAFLAIVTYLTGNAEIVDALTSLLVAGGIAGLRAAK